MSIRRLYRKTIEGVVDLADTAFRHLGLKKNNVSAYLHSLNRQRTW